MYRIVCTSVPDWTCNVSHHVVCSEEKVKVIKMITDMGGPDAFCAVKKNAEKYFLSWHRDFFYGIENYCFELEAPPADT